jgi:hypothetical protein
MIEKILRLQQRFEPARIVKPADVAGELAAAPPPERAVRRIILFSPAFGESLPGEPFPPWLIPAKMRPPDCPEWKQFCLVRSELTEDDLLDDDPFSRCLRPCLQDPRRLNLLIVRKDLRPGQIEGVTDSEHIKLLCQRRDLYPADIKKMARKIRSSLVGRVPPRTESSHAAALTHKGLALLSQRPDLRPEHLTSMIETMARQTQNQPTVDLPKMFTLGLDTLQRDGSTSVGEARQQAQASISSGSAPAASSGAASAGSAGTGSTGTGAASGSGAGAAASK